MPKPRAKPRIRHKHDDVLRRIAAVARELRQAALPRKTEPFSSQLDRLDDAVDDVAKAWSGSPLGRHANIYLEDLRAAQPGENFDGEWGVDFDRLVSQTRGPWQEYDTDTVREEVYRRARMTRADFDAILDAANEVQNRFVTLRATLEALLRALLTQEQDDHLASVVKDVAKATPGPTQDQFAGQITPPSPRICRDSAAVAAGRRVPPHLQVRANSLAAQSRFMSCANLALVAESALDYLRTKYQLAGTTSLKSAKNVFIGHGRSNEYLKLVNFIDKRLHLSPVYYEDPEPAGSTTQERVDEMMEKVDFALLVFTSEDRQADGTVRARQNVVQEYGRMEQRLGRKKAIILLENGCQKPSNDTNVGHIPFPTGMLEATWEPIREVLERGGLL